MGKKNISKNYIVNTIYQLILVLIPLFTLPHLSRVLGADGIGLYSFNNSIVSYFVLFAAAGTGVYGQREIAYKQDNKQDYSRVFFEVQILRTVLTIVSLFSLFFFTIFWGKDKIVLFIFLFSLLNIIFDISWFWNGLEKFSFIAVVLSIFKILYLGFIFLCIKKPSDVYLYIAGEIVFGMASYLSLWPHLKKYICKVKNLHPFSHTKAVFVLLMPTIATQLYTVFDKTMLGYLSIESYAENGFYEQAQGVIKSCLVLVSSLVTVMSPTIANFHAKGEFKKMKEYMYNSYRYVWLVTILLFVVVFTIAPFFIPIYFGPGYDKVASLVRICSPMFLIIGLSNVTGLQYFVPCDKIKEHMTSLVIGSVINIGLNMVLIPRLQSVGASIASVIAECCVTTAQFIFVFRLKTFKISKIFLSSIKYFIAGFITFGAGMIYLYSVKTTLLNIIIAMIMQLIIYAFVLRFILRDKMVILGCKKIKYQLLEKVKN